MKIVELKSEEFNDFSQEHALGTYCQSSLYAKIMQEAGYNIQYIGMQDNEGELVAASLILYKKIGFFQKYAYAPKGFLINYDDKELLETFTTIISKYYKKRGFVLIKINPEIIIGNLNTQTLKMEYNEKLELVDTLKSLGYKRRKEVSAFDLLMPKLSAFISLKDFKLNDADRKLRTKVKSSQDKGLVLETGSADNIDILYGFIKEQEKKPLRYFKRYYNIFKKEEKIDLVICKVDYETFLENTKNKYQEELDRNAIYNDKIKSDPSDKNMSEKMNSDKIIIELKKDLVEATEGLKTKKVAYIAAALIVKFKNKLSIVYNGYDPKYKDLYPSHFMYNEIIERYKDEYDYLDIGGIAGEFDPGNKYYGSDKFKLKFNPQIVEYIGEFDLILNKLAFKGLEGNKALEAEFLNNEDDTEEKNTDEEKKDEAKS